MEPVIATLIAALAAGALAASKDVAGSVIKDAYAGLKKLIVGRFKKAQPAIEALEANPTAKSQHQALADLLTGTEIDPTLKSAALRVIDALEEIRDDPRAQAVFDFGKLRAARNFELSDVEFTGTLLRADDATFEGDFAARELTQRPNQDVKKK